MTAATTAKYFEKAKRLLIRGHDFTLTVMVQNRGFLPYKLHYHGFKLRHRRWEKHGDILYAQLERVRN